MLLTCLLRPCFHTKINSCWLRRTNPSRRWFYSTRQGFLVRDKRAVLRSASHQDVSNQCKQNESHPPPSVRPVNRESRQETSKIALQFFSPLACANSPCLMRPLPETWPWIFT